MINETAFLDFLQSELIDDGPCCYWSATGIIFLLFVIVELAKTIFGLIFKRCKREK